MKRIPVHPKTLAFFTQEAKTIAAQVDELQNAVRDYVALCARIEQTGYENGLELMQARDRVEKCRVGIRWIY